MDIDRFAKMKENLVDTGDGVYFSKNDPQLWKKLLNKNPDDEKVMYQAALCLEAEARQNLLKYKKTGLIFYWFLYKQKIRDSLELLKKSWRNGYLFAGREILRIDDNLRENRINKVSGPWLGGAGLAALLLVCFLLGMGMALWLLSGNTYIFKENTEKKYTYLLPYEVIEERPVYIPDRDYQIRTIEIDGVVSREKVVNELMAAMKKLYQEESESPKKVLAVQTTGFGQREVGMAVWPGENGNIKVYVYLRDERSSISSADDMRLKYLLWETTTVIRSALYQFVKKNGYMPGDISALARPYPNNYLTAIPREPYNMSNTVYSSYNGGGGWVYSVRNAALPEESVKWSLKPNLPVEADIPFTPLYVLIDKKNNLLSIVSGDQTIKTYPVALGKEGSTPEGDFHIARKIMNPNKGVPGSGSTYGKRLMELSWRDFAIHGTDAPDSIGKKETLGCIRLYNPDMEELYAMVPLYSAVRILNSNNGGLAGAGLNISETSRQQGPRQDPEGLYDKTENPGEESGVICTWSG